MLRSLCQRSCLFCVINLLHKFAPPPSPNSVSLCVSLPVSLSLSVWLSVGLSLALSVCLSLFLSLCLSLSLSVCLSLSLCLCLSLPTHSVSLLLSLSVSLSLSPLLSLIPILSGDVHSVLGAPKDPTCWGAWDTIWAHKAKREAWKALRSTVSLERIRNGHRNTGNVSKANLEKLPRDGLSRVRKKHHKLNFTELLVLFMTSRAWLNGVFSPQIDTRSYINGLNELLCFLFVCFLMIFQYIYFYFLLSFLSTGLVLPLGLNSPLLLLIFCNKFRREKSILLQVPLVSNRWACSPWLKTIKTENFTQKRIEESCIFKAATLLSITLWHSDWGCSL